MFVPQAGRSIRENIARLAACTMWLVHALFIGGMPCIMELIVTLLGVEWGECSVMWQAKAGSRLGSLSI